MMVTTKRINVQHLFLLSFFFLAMLGLGSYGLHTDPLVNLWSLQYLWTQTKVTSTSSSPLRQVSIELLAQSPQQHSNSHVWRARAALQAGSPLQAQELIQPALATGNKDAARLYAEIRFHLGDYQEAITVWLNQGDVDSLIATGRNAAEANNNGVALATYEAAYQLAPERTVLYLASFLWRTEAAQILDLPEDITQQSFVNQHRYRIGEQSAAAEELLRQYLAQYPASRYQLTWLSELGALYQTYEDWNRAAATFEALLTVAPDRITDRINLGWVYYERGDGAEAAIQQFQQAIDLNSEKGTGYYAIATVLARENAGQAADIWYAQALEREPNQRWWWLMRGQNALKADDIALALQIYDVAQQRFPTDAVTHLQAAAAYQQNEDRQRTVETLQQAWQYIDHTLAGKTRRERLRNADNLVRMGNLYLWAGHQADAMRAYEEALRFDPHRREANQKVQTLYGN